jgi:hypothetical protein
MTSPTPPTGDETGPPPAVAPTDKPQTHNASVDEAAAETGACGQLHLPTGRTCTLVHGHDGACDFVARTDVQASVEDRRAAEHWSPPPR